MSFQRMPTTVSRNQENTDLCLQDVQLHYVFYLKSWEPGEGIFINPSHVSQSLNIQHSFLSHRTAQMPIRFITDCWGKISSEYKAEWNIFASSQKFINIVSIPKVTVTFPGSGHWSPVTYSITWIHTQALKQMYLTKWKIQSVLSESKFKDVLQKAKKRALNVFGHLRHLRNVWMSLH